MPLLGPRQSRWNFPHSKPQRFGFLGKFCLDVHLKSILVFSLTGCVTFRCTPTSQDGLGLTFSWGKLCLPTLTWCDFRSQGPMTLVGSGHPLNNYICENKVKTVERVWWNGIDGAMGVLRMEMGIIWNSSRRGDGQKARAAWGAWRDLLSRTACPRLGKEALRECVNSHLDVDWPYTVSLDHVRDDHPSLRRVKETLGGDLDVRMSSWLEESPCSM